MAKDNKKDKAFDSAELDKMLATGGFLFKEPEKTSDGLLKTPRWETGIIMFDKLLNGGLPKGATIAVGAEPGVGKTTLLIQALCNISERYNKKTYYIDVEGGATYELIASMGFSDLLWHPKDNPTGLFYLLSAETIQDIAKLIKHLTKDPDTAAIVIDSDTSVVDGNALEDEELGMGKGYAAGDARMWSRASKPIGALIKKSNACLLIIHQARVDLSGFMPKTVATGGNAAKHLASAEIFGKRKGWIGDGNVMVPKREQAVGALVSFSTSKNRLTMPFAAVEMPIFFGRGVSNKWAYKSWLEDFDVVDQATGEVNKALSMKGGGFYTLRLPSGEHKARGDAGVWAIIDEKYEEIVDFVERNGGFKLGKAEDELGED